VEEVRVLQSSFQLANLDDAQIAVFSKNGTITPKMTAALQKIAAQKVAVSKLEEEMENRQKDIDRIVADQARLRENMKALKGSAEEKTLVQRYTSELDQQETQLDSLRKTIQNTEAQRDKANDELENMIDSIQIESSF
jgi:chromosome segregation ATPase